MQATDENTGTAYTGEQLTANPADGTRPTRRWTRTTGTWNLTVNPGVFPSLTDKIKFVATRHHERRPDRHDHDHGQDGSPEVVTPVQLGAEPQPIGAGYSDQR